MAFRFIEINPKTRQPRGAREQKPHRSSSGEKVVKNSASFFLFPAFRLIKHSSMINGGYAHVLVVEPFKKDFQNDEAVKKGGNVRACLALILPDSREEKVHIRT